MSVNVSPPVGAQPPGRRRGWRGRLVAALTLVAALAASLFVSATPAFAGSHGVGYDDGAGFIGAYNTGQNSDGVQAYCMDAGITSPFSPTTGPEVVTSLDSLSRQQLAELNYVLAKWGQSSDPSVTAAVAMYTWQIASADVYNAHGADYYLGRVPAAQRQTVANNLAAFGQEAAANAVVDPALGLSIAMSDQYHGTLTVAANPTGLPVTVTLSDAVLTGSGSATGVLSPGSYAITGTPADGAPSYRISASGSADGTGYGAHVNLYTSGSGEQRIINAVSGIPAALNASAQSPVIELDFQPELTTAVAARYVKAGDAFTDALTASVTKGTWIKLDGTPIPVTATGTLYGPFDAQPAQASAPPANAPVAGRETITLTGAGDYTSAGSITAASSGFYVWVWAIDKTAQGQYGKYLTGSFTDQFALVPESHVSPFQPKAVSTANGHLVNPGTEVTDTIVVTSANGPWLKLDGKPIPVVFTGTAYQVPGTLPPAQANGVASGARPVGVVQVTAEGPGTYTSPGVVLPSPGFVTWVWTARVADQPASVRDYLAGDFTDDYGLPVETHSVRWPVTVTSQVREYNVAPGGRAFDTITVSGFPADHPGFGGDGYWKADAPEVVNTVYGPFTTDSVLTDDLDLATAPVLTRITTPAKNDVYKLGYTDADAITVSKPGYYVVVTTFAGDDRVQPYASSPGDILERFYVPGPTPPPLTVITQATSKAAVGEPFSDTALVQGDTPTGAYLVFRAYGPQPAKDADGKPVTPVCETPFYESQRVPVTQAGIYHSGETTIEAAGNVYWVETLYNPDDEVLVAGVCGAPGETTTVTAPVPPTVTTKAVAQVQLGQSAHDTAIVTGTAPDGATLTFEAFRQPDAQPGKAGDAVAVCTGAESVFTTKPIPVTEAGEYDSETVMFDQIGTYFWVETLHDRDGTVIHRGECGTPGETTVVTDTPTPPAGPRVDTGGALATTGAPGWMLPVGILIALMLLASGFVLWFGRRLAIRREAEGYEREEDTQD